jgi:hypothetical protein
MSFSGKSPSTFLRMRWIYTSTRFVPGSKLILPDAFANLDARQHAARRAHEMFEQGKFPRGEFDAAARPAGLRG